MANQTSSPGSSSRTIFFGILLVIIAAGAFFIYRQGSGSGNRGMSPEALARLAELREQYADAGPPQPYVHGNQDAPVVIEEFADYECPSCARFATITEPDVRRRIVDAGLAVYKFYDFPLPGHPSSPLASHAAACADEQGKFWEMHDQLFANQHRWGMDPSTLQAPNNVRGILSEIAESIGLDTDQWGSCMDTEKYMDRVVNNAAEAVRRNVLQTPTFFVNGVRREGIISYDEMKRLVDEAAEKGPMSATDSAMGNLIAH